MCLQQRCLHHFMNDCMQLTVPCCANPAHYIFIHHLASWLNASHIKPLLPNQSFFIRWVKLSLQPCNFYRVCRVFLWVQHYATCVWQAPKSSAALTCIGQVCQVGWQKLLPSTMMPQGQQLCLRATSVWDHIVQVWKCVLHSEWAQAKFAKALSWCEVLVCLSGTVTIPSSAGGLRGQGSCSRTLDLLELYCGRAAITHAAIRRNLKAVGIDRDEGTRATMVADLCTLAGARGGLP